ncbi:MAG: PilZ domain-containing protein [Gammaproteobacteria bacterium]|nr:PilZ domain-containing protein [Gammaproteobacteria bacterium]MDH5727757.1 PilZ domain-containing protein [Gammaproteobacteria bacterium]
MSEKIKPGSIINLNIDDKNRLHSAYMPYIKNGGLYIYTDKTYRMGDDIFLTLNIPDDPDTIAVSCRVVWITPKDAQGNRQAGVGVQFRDAGNARHRIETCLAGMLQSERHTDTM